MRRKVLRIQRVTRTGYTRYNKSDIAKIYLMILRLFNPILTCYGAKRRLTFAFYSCFGRESALSVAPKEVFRTSILPKKNPEVMRDGSFRGTAQDLPVPNFRQFFAE
jgi:hypothetical protein